MHAEHEVLANLSVTLGYYNETNAYIVNLSTIWKGYGPSLLSATGVRKFQEKLNTR